MADPGLRTNITAGASGQIADVNTVHAYVNKHDSSILSGGSDGDVLTLNGTTSRLELAAVPLSTADRDHTPYVCTYNGTAYEAPPNDVPAGLAYYDSFGYPGAPAPAYGASRPSALDGDKWFPDPDAT